MYISRNNRKERNNMSKVSSKTHTSAQINNYANQGNSNNAAHRANSNNHSNQLNPNNKSYQPANKSGKK